MSIRIIFFILPLLTSATTTDAATAAAATRRLRQSSRARVRPFARTLDWLSSNVRHDASRQRLRRHARLWLTTMTLDDLRLILSVPRFSISWFALSNVRLFETKVLLT